MEHDALSALHAEALLDHVLAGRVPEWEQMLISTNLIAFAIRNATSKLPETEHIRLQAKELHITAEEQRAAVRRGLDLLIKEAARPNTYSPIIVLNKARELLG